MKTRARCLRILGGAAVASLLVFMACGGEGVQEDAGDADASATASAETRDGGQTHSHEGGEEHSHDGAGTHSHPAADTLASDIALSASPEESWSGSATVMTIGDSVRILVSVEGVSTGSRHPVELVAGSCEDVGSELASLTPVVAGTSGKGSSQTTLSTARLDGHAHGAIRLLSDDDAPAACAQVHLAAAEHEHGQDDE
jgi:hypothetical protein